MHRRIRTPLAALIAALSLTATVHPQDGSILVEGEERHLRNVRQLTFGGENAEGYFHPDGEHLIYQAHDREGACDQIYIMELSTGESRMVSTGDGVTTCSFFIPGSDRFIYASTHAAGEECPPRPDPSLGYVWPLHEGYDIYKANLNGEIVQRLTDAPGYDAEAAVSPDGREIVFCSLRSGDLELYKMNVDGSGLRRLTWTLGYDGGPFFSPQGTYIVYRSHHPKTAEETAEVRRRNEKAVVSPMRLEIWLMRADGSEQRQVTRLGAASFGPYMHPDEERIIFSTNYSEDGAHRKRGMPNFDLYMVHKNGTGLERITRHPGFDGFPMFSHDGRWLVFASNRNAEEPSETNLYLAEWVD